MIEPIIKVVVGGFFMLFLLWFMLNRIEKHYNTKTTHKEEDYTQGEND